MRETGFILKCNFRSSSSEDTHSQIKLGDLVKINGIIAQPELNGLKGKVTVVTPERIGVKIYDRNTSYSLKPEKLEKIKLAHVPTFDDILNRYIPHITEENRDEVIGRTISKLRDPHSTTQYNKFEKIQLENLILCLTKKYTIEQLKDRLEFQSYMMDFKEVGDVFNFLRNKPSNVKDKETIILRDFPILGKDPTTKNYRKNYHKAITKYKIPSVYAQQLLKLFDEGHHKRKPKVDGVTPQSLLVLSLAEYMSDEFISS